MSGRIWIGVLFLLFGFLFLLHQTDVIDFPQLLSNGWPLILIIIGVIQLVSRKHSSATSGFLFLFIGLLFSVNQWLDLNLTAYIWPLIFIVIGIVIIFTRGRHEKSSHHENDLDTFVFLSGAAIKSQSKALQGGSITCILGGAEIDLRHAVITDGAVLELTTILGGAEITVPRNVQVEVSGTPFLGGWEDQTRIDKDDEEVLTLQVNCVTILGGVEVRN
jgi:predicted membrane protein